MNPQESIFSGYGVYEGGSGVALGEMACPGGQMEAWPGAGFCIPTISTPTGATCQPGTVEPWGGAGFCVPIGGVTPGMPAPAATPSGTPVIPGPCPAGTIGIPPNCFPLPTTPGQPGPGSIPIPVPIPGGPLPQPGPAPAPPVSSASTTGGGLPSWALPAAIGVGAIALIAVLASGKKRAASNRRRRHRRNRRRY